MNKFRELDLEALNKRVERTQSKFEGMGVDKEKAEMLASTLKEDQKAKIHSNNLFGASIYGLDRHERKKLANQKLLLDVERGCTDFDTNSRPRTLGEGAENFWLKGIACLFGVCRSQALVGKKRELEKERAMNEPLNVKVPQHAESQGAMI